MENTKPPLFLSLLYGMGGEDTGHHRNSGETTSISKGTNNRLFHLHSADGWPGSNVYFQI
ncbi:MAG: hypothetical protein ACTHKY_13960 [Ginsengibacter sp.]